MALPRSTLSRFAVECIQLADSVAWERSELDGAFDDASPAFEIVAAPRLAFAATVRGTLSPPGGSTSPAAGPLT